MALCRKTSTDIKPRLMRVMRIASRMKKNAQTIICPAYTYPLVLACSGKMSAQVSTTESETVFSRVRSTNRLIRLNGTFPLNYPFNGRIRGF